METTQVSKYLIVTVSDNHCAFTLHCTCQRPNTSSKPLMLNKRSFADRKTWRSKDPSHSMSCFRHFMHSSHSRRQLVSVYKTKIHTKLFIHSVARF